MWGEIFLVLHIPCNFRLYHGHFEYSVIRLWVLCKSYDECRYFSFTRQLIQLGSGYKFYQSSVDFGFSVCHFQNLGSTVWIYPVNVPPSSQSDTWVGVCPLVLNIFAMLFRLRSDMYSFGVSLGIHMRLSRTAFPSSSLSEIVLVFFGSLSFPFSLLLPESWNFHYPSLPALPMPTAGTH